MTDEHGTALGSAHARFLDSLAERGRELRELADALEPTPGDDRLAERLRRRVHALYASAQLFQESTLLDRLSPLVERLDAARDSYRPVSPDELAQVRSLSELLGIGDEEIVPAPRSRSLRGGERWSVPPLQRDRNASPSDPSLLLTQTIAGGVIAPEVIAALLVASPEVESEVRAALPAEYCEITSTGEAETALLVIDHVAPDLVMIEVGSLREGAETLITGLRGERRAIVALLPELASETDAQLGLAWADAVLRLPLPRAGLLERLQRLAGRGARPQSALERLNAGTIDEIARSIGDEVRRGITGALRTGRAERIELGDKTELLAATWSAVARIRAHLADRAHGRVRFDGSVFAGEPFSLALTDDEPAAPYVGLSESLAGRRIVIVDDDPSVVWFFAGLVREAGAIAVEARDGREALALMRKHPPDLLVSDIVMPEIDGFGLCRELKRDVALSHVPVVLLSWKEDFLQRMRELDSGASAYLRKEAGTHQILSTLAEALRPRAALASLLSGGGEVHGRVDTLGVATLLRTVAECRPNARISVRDAWNLFEIDLRDGTRLSITRTAADGSFARGRPALLQLLGVDVGRFGVDDAEGPLRGELGEPLERALHEALAELGGLFDALSDTWLMQVARVDLDDEVLRPLLAATPTALADLVHRLRAGASPQELLVSGVVSARELEQQLRELARRGAIVRASARDGSDLALAAWRAREERPGELMHGGEHAARSSLPPPLAETDVQWLEQPRGERPARTRSSRPPPVPRRVTRSAPPPPLRRAVRARVASGPVPPLPSARAATAAAAASAASSGSAASSEPSVVADSAERAGSDSAELSAADVTAAESSIPPAVSATSTTTSHAPPLPARTTTSAAPAATVSGAIVAGDSSAAPPPTPSARARAARAAAGVTPNAVPAGDAGPEPMSRRSLLFAVISLSAVAALGFFGHRWLAPKIAPPAPRPAHVQPSPVAPVAPATPQQEPLAATLPANGTDPAPSAEATAAANEPQAATEATGEQPAEDEAAAEVAADTRAPTQLDAVEVTPGYGRVLPFIDQSRGVQVAPGEGLLVIDSEGGENAPSVRIAGRDIGRAPTAAALPPGRHELVLRRGTQTSFRYVVIRAGETRVVDGH